MSSKISPPGMLSSVSFPLLTFVVAVGCGARSIAAEQVVTAPILYGFAVIASLVAIFQAVLDCLGSRHLSGEIGILGWAAVALIVIAWLMPGSPALPA